MLCQSHQAGAGWVAAGIVFLPWPMRPRRFCKPVNLQTMPTVHLLIKGRVQGVYFRASAKNVADALGLVGWVRNTPDGQVEAMANGSDASLEQFVEWCRQGPPNAIVITVTVAAVNDEQFAGFSIRKR